MVAKHGGGTVFKSESPEQMAAAMQQVIDRPEIAIEWMREARDIVRFISMESVGKYLYDIVLYEFFQIGDKPRCPWM